MRLLLACLFGSVALWFAIARSAPAWGTAPPSGAVSERPQTPELSAEPASSPPKSSARSGPGEPQRSEVEEEVAKLIDKLGSPSYASRLRAKQKLQRLGLQAFEQLQRAQYHPDREVALASRHLVSSLLVSWSDESDPPEVRQALHEYGAQEQAERQRRIEVLAGLPHRQGLAALARLARYEPEPSLRREAALALMRQPISEEAAVRRRHHEVLLETLGGSDRPASQWLRLYAHDLTRDGLSIEAWQRLVRRQRDQEDEPGAAEPVSADVLLKLVRVCAKRAAEAGHRDDALRLVSTNLDLLPPTTAALMDLASWAIAGDLHPLVLELRRRHRQRFDDQPLLLYSAAEAFRAAGDKEQAEQLANQALAINPLPEDKAKLDAMSPHRIEEIGHSHRELGNALQKRGLFRWAEREYRHVIDSLDLTTPPAAVTRGHLSRMLAEQQRHAEVIEVLQPLIERIESDRDLMRRLNTLQFNYRSLRSDLEYHRGLLAIERGRPEAAKPHLRRALELDQANIDILIAMYRLDGGPEWNHEVRQQLQQTIQVTETAVRTAEVQAQQIGPLGLSDRQLAQLLNQYAWLVCNTEGDYQKALRYSQRSLELMPDNAALLDTCAHCHAALGDYTAAVAKQRRAVQLMPHSPPLVRKLKEFEAKLENQAGHSEKNEGHSDENQTEQDVELR